MEQIPYTKLVEAVVWLAKFLDNFFAFISRNTFYRDLSQLSTKSLFYELLTTQFDSAIKPAHSVVITRLFGPAIGVGNEFKQSLSPGSLIAVLHLIPDSPPMLVERD